MSKRAPTRAVSALGARSRIHRIGVAFAMAAALSSGQTTNVTTFEVKSGSQTKSVDLQHSVPSGSQDTDGNGLPDQWEITNFGHIGVDPNADPDGDGFTNLQEYQNGTNPNDFYNGQQAQLLIISGNNQSAMAGQFNVLAFEVIVRNSAGTAPLSGAPVTFTVAQGGGLLALTDTATSSLAATLTLRTNPDGTAQVFYQQPSAPSVLSQITVSAGTAQTAFNTESSAPITAFYSTDFETGEGYTPGSLAGQQGWKVFNNIVDVTAADFYSGSQSVILPAGNPVPVASNVFPAASDASEPIVFLDLYAKLAADPDVNSSAQLLTDIAWVDLKKEGDRGEVYVFDGDGATTGVGWKGTGYMVPLNVDNQASQWLRFTFRLDFVHQTWDLYANGEMIAADVLSNNPTAIQLSFFDIFGCATAAVGLDDIHASYDNPLFKDADKDGMDDVWELAHGLDPTINDRNLDPDGDGLTNVQEFMHGTDPHKADTDGDGMSDQWEVSHGLNPLDPSDAAAISSDGSGLTNLQEYVAASLQPPGAPGNLRIVGQTTTQLTLAWDAAQPAPQHTVAGYQVDLNGQATATTAALSITVPYDSSSSAQLQYFTVQAIDEANKVSASSNQVLAPRPTDATDASLELKTVGSNMSKSGFGGLLTAKFYKTAVFNKQDNASNGTASYSDTLTMTEKYDLSKLNTPDYRSFVVTGEMNNTLYPNVPPHSDWVSNDSGTHGSEAVRSPSFFPYDYFNSPSTYANDLANMVPGAQPVSDTDIKSTYDQTTADNIHQTGSRELTLSDEFTDQDLQNLVIADIAQQVAAIDSQPWQTQDFDIYYASNHTSHGAGGVLEQIAQSFSYYRLHSTSTGLTHFRWVEVFYPADGSAPQASPIKEETVQGGPDGADTSVHLLGIPTAEGDANILLATGGITVDTPSMHAQPGDPRLFLAGAIFVGEAAGLNVQGVDWGDTSKAILTVAGDASTVQMFLVDPGIVASQGMPAAVAQGHQIASGIDLLENPDWLNNWTLAAVGLAPGKATVSLGLTVSGASYTLSTTLQVFPKFELAVDANRDGQIKFPSEDNTDLTSAAKPFTFWINDGVDGPSTAPNESSVQDSLESGTPNCEQGSITCTRDLENFSRMWIDVNGFAAIASPSSSTLQIGVKWQNTGGAAPAINLYLSADPSGSDSYLTDSTGAAEQAQTGSQFRNAITDANGAKNVAANSTFILPTSTWQNLTNANPVEHFLFEGDSEGAGQLTLVILDQNGKELGEGPSVYLDLRDIKELYERWTVGDGNGGPPAPVAGISANRLPAGVHALVYNSINPGLSVPGAPTQNAYILFVHGWNLPPWERDAFAESALKRLFWQGYKGKFGTFEWPTTYTTIDNEYFADLQEIAIYDDGEFSAWQSAVPLEQLLEYLHRSYGNNLYLFAHSMGNVVAGEALRIAGQAGVGPLVNMYVATQAAVPAHCYDPSLAGADLLSFSSINVNGANISGSYGPTTPDIYGNWLAPTGPAMLTKVNFFNINDYALNYWQGDQVLKPDVRNYTYFYQGSADDSPAKDLFGKALATLPALVGFVPLHLGDATNVQDRYEIMAYDAEPRSKALGGVPDAAGFAPQNLLQPGFWPNDTFPQINGPYSAHPWHSAEFRFTNADQQNYWHTLLGPDGFNLTPP
jgi:Bacterial TSP3 repeat/Alpha/beta hydrolase of unknown function (DUF900)